MTVAKLPTGCFLADDKEQHGVLQGRRFWFLAERNIFYLLFYSGVIVGLQISIACSCKELSLLLVV